MKRFSKFFLLLFVLSGFLVSTSVYGQDRDKKKSKSSTGSTYVKGHTRHTKSGKTTYVKPHYRKK